MAGNSAEDRAVLFKPVNAEELEQCHPSGQQEEQQNAVFNGYAKSEKLAKAVRHA
jgi:hypothetical protein